MGKSYISKILGAAFMFTFVVSAAPTPLISYPILPQKVVTGGDISVPIHEEIEVSINGRPQRLHLTGAGVRKKTKLIFTADVYVAASYLDNAGGFAKQLGEGLDVIRRASARAMLLTFVRGVSANQVRDSFKDALKENGADLESPPIKELFAKLVTDLPERSTVSFVSSSQDPKEDVVNVEIVTPKNENAKFTVRGPKLATTLWSMWFGNAADGGLGDLKAVLMGMTPAN
jgi:hypothetical protein